MSSKIGKKRRRRDAITASQNSAYLNIDTIRIVMGPAARILSLVDFIRQYLPNLPELSEFQDTEDDLRLRNSLFCPSESLKTQSRCTKVQRGESLDSLVDDVIWSMVQRRGPWIAGKDTRNVLSNGYVVASERTHQRVQPCPNMRPGVICHRINSNVSFCKTSTFCHRLHELVGDDVLRMLLLRTTIFLPIEDDWHNRRGNYLQLCGPTLHPKPIILPGQIFREEGGAELRNKKIKRSSRRSELEANAGISRQSMFYSSIYVPKVGLPAVHELNSATAVELLRSILSMHTLSKNKKRNFWKRIRGVGVSLCDQILKGHAKCDYTRLLNRYCPLPDSVFQRKDGSGPPITPDLTRLDQEGGADHELSELSASHAHPDGVVSFLRVVLRRTFPAEFWGSEHNFASVSLLLKTFVYLRRQEMLPNKRLVKGLRVTDIRWLVARDSHVSGFSKTNRPARKRKLSRSEHESASKMAIIVMRWVFSKFVIPLLRSCFYITESEMHSKRVLYYRRPVWSMFRTMSIKKLLKRQYREIDRTEALARLKKQSMGLSRLRLLPKKTGVRPLALLSIADTASYRPSRSVDQSTIGTPHAKPLSTNSILRNAFEVLRFEHLQDPQASGAGIFGVNEAYPLLREFLRKVRRSKVERPLFFASVDIKHCYDSINQRRMLELVREVLSEDDYLIQNCSVMYPFRSMGRIFKRRLRDVGPPDAFRQFHHASHDLARDRRGSIFIDGVGCALAKKDQIVALLEEHLTSHLVVLRGRYGERFFVQTAGIPQGSVLSSLLCNFYYGRIEKELLGDVLLLKEAESHSHLLLRVVDDFLLITTDPSMSAQFVSIMTHGDKRLGVQINDDKTRVSHGLTFHTPTGKVVALDTASIPGENHKAFFPWCGLMIDVASGEIRLDLSRFADDKATDGLTVDRSGSEGRQLRIRMNSFVRPRCLSLLFDAEVNSPDVVGINFHQVMLICAVKTARYVVDCMDKAERNESYLLRCIDDVIVFSHKLISERLSRESVSSSTFPLQQSFSTFLGIHAFVEVFQELEWAQQLTNTLKAKCNEEFDSREELLRIATMSSDQFRLYCRRS